MVIRIPLYFIYGPLWMSALHDPAGMLNTGELHLHLLPLGDDSALGPTFLTIFSGAFCRPASSLYLALLYLSPISLTSLVPWHKS